MHSEKEFKSFLKVEVVPYNPEWKQKYLAESELIKKACGDKILIIEHAGSTSVEGLAAKPIIDIYIGTRTLEDAHSMIEPMTAIGHEYYDKFEDELPFRRYFRKFINGKREFHVHVTPADHRFRNIDLIFRDYVSVNKKAKLEYENHKLELSEIDWKDEMLSYNQAKDEICLRIKDDALRYFSGMFEQTESEATWLMHKYASTDAMKKASFKMIREGELTAIRADIFPGFSLNRALGITKIDEDFLGMIEDFYKGKPGKFALQIPPDLLNEETTRLLESRGYTYANSWVTFYKDSSPIQSRGADLEIKEISKERSKEFAYILNEVFGFPHEFDDIAASSIGEKECITFMAFDNGKPVGSAGIYITGKTAYLSFANILPEYRRRGLQGELLRLRIDAAREQGAKWIFVDTAENSEENPNPSYWNMLRHGFRLMYKRPNYVKVFE